MKEFGTILEALLAPGAGETVLATLVAVQGSSYRRPGARLLVNREGRRTGSISGGCLEEDVLARAKRVLATGQAETITYDTTSENDLVWGVGLGCHGVVSILLEKLAPRPPWALTLAQNLAARRPTRLAVVHQADHPADLGTRLADEIGARRTGDNPGIFFESVRPPTALFIFGAGDDAQPLVRLARELGWHVTLADPRANFATAERFPDAAACVVGPAGELVRRADPGADAVAVIMTHHYVHDVPLLRDLLSRQLAYLGLLGPKKRAEKIRADLARSGLSAAIHPPDHFRAPVGLDVGAETPEQVALAIVAEIQAVLTRRDGGPLRDRRGPIHA